MKFNEILGNDLKNYLGDLFYLIYGRYLIPIVMRQTQDVLIAIDHPIAFWKLF